MAGQRIVQANNTLVDPTVEQWDQSTNVLFIAEQWDQLTNVLFIAEQWDQLTNVFSL